MWPEGIIEELDSLAKIVLFFLLKSYVTLGFAKLIKNKILQNFQPFSHLSFCKMLQKRHFSFFYLYPVLPVTERAKAACKHKYDRGTICQLFSPSQGSLELKQGLQVLSALMIHSVLRSAFCFGSNPSMLSSAPSPLCALASKRAWIFFISCINSFANVQLQPLLVLSCFCCSVIELQAGLKSVSSFLAFSMWLHAIVLKLLGRSCPCIL